MGWGLLIPRGWVGTLTLGGVSWGVVNAIRFSDTITIGSIIVAAMVVIAGGVVTFRNNMRTFWRNLAEERAEQIKVLEEYGRQKDAHILHIQEQSKQDLAHFTEEQRELRHELKNQLAAMTHNLQLAQSKTDLTSLLDELSSHHVQAMANMEKGLERQSRILELLEARELH